MPTDPQLDTISLLLLVGLGYTVLLLSRRGWSFWTGTLAGEDRQLAGQAAFFLTTPPTVLLHELGHAVTTWLLGQHVLELHYMGFSGYVRSAGSFTPSGLWLLAVSGSAVSVAVAVLLMAAGQFGRRLPVPVRYLLIVGGGVQAALALAAYPLWSILGRFGDWVQIYDFKATPTLGAITLTFHIVIVIALRVWWQRSLKPLVAQLERGGAASTAGAVEAEVADAAGAVHAAMALLEQADYAGAEGVARSWVDTADGAVRAHLLFVLGVSQFARMRYGEAVGHLQQALALSQDDSFRQRVLANLMLGYTQDHRSKEALAVYEQLSPEWRAHPGVQRALDVIQVRTGKRPPP